MRRRDYMEQVYTDACEMMDDNREEFAGMDEWDAITALSCDYDVTGNMNGSYYCNSHRAAEACGGVMWDGDFREWLHDMATDVPEDPESFDVLYRIFTLETLVRDEVADYQDDIRDEMAA